MFSCFQTAGFSNGRLLISALAVTQKIINWQHFSRPSKLFIHFSSQVDVR